MHEDEYILSIDHENAIPSYGHNGGDADDYKVDSDFINNRWNAYPWSFFYLNKQTKDDFWTNRTLFFSGPYDDNNPDDYSLPTFAIGSLLDGYRDAAVQIYDWLKAKKVPVKLAMSPSNHALPDQVYPGPAWDWKEEAAGWFRRWLFDLDEGSTHYIYDIDSNATDYMTDDILMDNNFAIFVRLPGDDTNRVPGFWTNVNWTELSSQPRTMYFMSSGSTLSSSAKIGGGGRASKEEEEKEVSVDTLRYQPAVGIEMGEWWGEATPDQVGTVGR